MIINVDDISQVLENSIGRIEKEIEYKILFGAVGGSYSLGLQNSSSDIDLYLILDSDEIWNVFEKKIGIYIHGKHRAIDCICVSYQEMIREIKKYINKPKQYPTVLFRNEEEKKDNIGKKDIERLDFKRSILFRILLSDKIINKGVAQIKFREFKDGMKIADIIDYHYTRIYGNYHEKIINNDFIPVRKYLYTVHEICTCMYLMYNKGKPPMNMIALIDSVLSDVLLKDRIYKLYEKNRDTLKNKREELTKKDEFLNQFILKSMEEIEICLRGRKYLLEFLYI